MGRRKDLSRPTLTDLEANVAPVWRTRLAQSPTPRQRSNFCFRDDEHTNGVDGLRRVVRHCVAVYKDVLLEIL
jgi:hypothetical protein